LLAKPTPHNVNHGNDRFSMFNKKRDICRAQIFEALGGLLQFGIEAANAEPAQGCFHPVDNPGLLSDETAPSCAVAGTGSPAAPAAFACAADLNGGGRQEVIVGYPTNGGAATYRAVIISANGKITQLNY
jgi:hypothetical protein